jgi:diguanylate cyclase (GGDEF)-like protein
MDPRTALLVASVMSLLNGGLLGLMHRSLLFEVRRSAVDWRIGTLLLAGAGLLLVVQDSIDVPPAEPDAVTLLGGVLLPLAYLMIFVGVCLYWRSIRRFCGESDPVWIFLPAVFGGGVVFVFTALVPSMQLRNGISTALVALVLIAAARTLQTSRRTDVVVSRRAFVALLYAIGFLLLVRAVYFGLQLIAPGAETGIAWLYPATLFAIPVLPVIGTTAFLLMTAERGRQALQRAAHTDELTGLPNRRSIQRSAQERFAAAREGAGDFAIAVLDVDRFKAINDRHGHAGGDLALRHIADVLARHCGAAQLLGRQGGEEFVVLCASGDEAEVVALAETLRRAIEIAPLSIGGEPLPITISIGASVLAAQDRDEDEVLLRADSALYAAKAGGRNRVELARR